MANGTVDNPVMLTHQEVKAAILAKLRELAAQIEAQQVMDWSLNVDIQHAASWGAGAMLRRPTGRSIVNFTLVLDDVAQREEYAEWTAQFIRDGKGRPDVQSFPCRCRHEPGPHKAGVAQLA